MMNSDQTRERHRNNLLLEKEGAQYLFLTQVVDKNVQTETGTRIGKLKDFVFNDDPHYAEVTSLVVGRSFGRPPLNVPWSHVVNVGTEKTIIREPPEGQYPEFKDEEDQLLLRDKILDKKVLDTKGFDVEVVYDIQLLFVEGKLFITGADVSRHALMRRLGLGRVAKSLLEHEPKERLIPWRYVQPIGPDLTSTQGDVKLTVAKEGLRDIHPEDVADILEELSREDRIHVFNALDSQSAADALEATEPRVQREILASTNTQRTVEIFSHMSPVQIADIISILPRDNAEASLRLLTGGLASKVNQLLTQHDVPASILAMHCFLGFPSDLTVDDAFVRFRKEAPGCDVTMYIYVVDSEQHIRGVIDIKELLQADPKDRLEKIMTRNIITVAPTTMRGDVEALFLKYHFRAIPVVDASNKILGVVREKDVFLTDEQR
jgi:sporulation protein YlmC with PRC-barrel domain